MDSSDNGTPAPLRFPQIVGGIYDLIEKLDPASRIRACKSALQMFPEEVPEGAFGPPAHYTMRAEQGAFKLTPTNEPTPVPEGSLQQSLPSMIVLQHALIRKRAQIWMRRHSLTEETLDQVFHIDDEKGTVELIAPVLGSTKREQSINCYVLTGLMELLRVDDPRFSDETAVALCREQSCYDGANHSQTRQMFGNRLSGSKAAGWTLTQPGLDAAANLVKTIAGVPLG
jgi:hypothetical protein